MALSVEQQEEIQENCNTLIAFLSKQGWSTGVTLATLQVTLESIFKVIEEMTEEGPENAGEIN